MSDLVARILSQMRLSGVTSVMLTEYVPLPSNMVSLWEQGKGKEPNSIELDKIAALLCVHPSHLLGTKHPEFVDTKPLPWTFKIWLARFRHVDLPIGDLSKELLSRYDFPEDGSYSEMLDYITSKLGHNPNIIEAFETSWNFYLATT